MVISSIPLETILQQHLQSNKTVNSNGQTPGSFYVASERQKIGSGLLLFSSSASPGDSYVARKIISHCLISSDLAFSNLSTAADNSNVGNIVSVSTEKVEMTNTDHDIMNNNVTSGNQHRNGSSLNTDEELTPLTWLHDKNLLKG
jgi:hypothetical protein